jgi:hypothetical protein
MLTQRGQIALRNKSLVIMPFLVPQWKDLLEEK